MSRVHILQEGAAVPDPLAPYAEVDRTRGPGPGWVMAHVVAGLDGSAAIRGRVGALSTAPDAKLFSLMRALADVVLVGAETVRAEGYGPSACPASGSRPGRRPGVRERRRWPWSRARWNSTGRPGRSPTHRRGAGRW